METALTFWIPHPQDSHIIDRKKFFGSRYTDTSECTYSIGEFRSSSLSRDEVLLTYKESTENLFRLAHYLPMHVVIIEKDTSLPLDNPADAWITDFIQNVGKSTSNTTYYLVYIYEEGKPWWGDIRCYSP